MIDRLFAYGTLLATELLAAIAGRAIEGHPATLNDFACYRVRRAVYPAIAPEQGATTDGQIFAGITSLEWGRLDQFESELYDRQEVAVQITGGNVTTAQTYVLGAAFRDRLTNEVWDLERFRARHLQRYLKHF